MTKHYYLFSEFMVILYIFMVSKLISSQEVFLDQGVIFRLWTVYSTSLGIPQILLTQHVQHHLLVHPSP